MLNITIRQGHLHKQRADAIIVNLFAETKSNLLEKAADLVQNRTIQQAISLKDFTGKLGETQLHYVPEASPFKRILIIGLGYQNDFDLESARRVAAISIRKLNEIGVRSAATTFVNSEQNGLSSQEMAQALAEGSYLALYRFESYRSKKSNKGIQKLTILVSKEKHLTDIKRGVKTGKSISEGTILARDLINEPANEITPIALANVAKELARHNDSIRCRVLSEPSIEKLGMGALLAVGQGSINRPQFIIIELNPHSKNRPLIFLGKGVTFDSGGLSLKSVSGIRTMKCDMAGAGAVIGAISAISKLKLKQRIIALIPAAENMPDGKSFRPGDVVKTLSGKTIEILSTDAEGRLILADALTYAERYNPDAVIDLATLTGASITALGHHVAGLFCSDDLLANRLIEAGRDTHEKVWRLPLWPEYREQIEGEVADLKNSGGPPGGASTAAALLYEFASAYPWAHIDIAGTATSNQSNFYTTRGGVGFGVRLLTHFAQSWSDNFQKSR
ncbi:MAG: leucyl aminopeptidase [Candidatus Latescibacterota bacterium]|nr:leucyl aminopeptidase [Candidatus Latescibacterota bacterium]